MQEKSTASRNDVHLIHRMVVFGSQKRVDMYTIVLWPLLGALSTAIAEFDCPVIIRPHINEISTRV